MARSGITNRVLGLEGVPQLSANVDKVIRSAAVRTETMNTLLRAAMIGRDEARAMVPVRTGRLRDSIFAGRGDPSKFRKGPSVVIGVKYGKGGAPHAHLVEYGSVRMPARPYFRPGVRAASPTMARVIAEGFKQIVEGAV